MTISSYVDNFSLNGVSLDHLSIEQSYQVTKFDFSMAFVYNPAVDDNQLSCCFMCSRDLFHKTTVTLMSQRFEYLFDQIFRNSSCVNLIDDSMILIKKLSMILPEEAAEMGSIIFHRLENTVNEGMWTDH
jgi:hypothetical protein